MSIRSYNFVSGALAPSKSYRINLRQRRLCHLQPSKYIFANREDKSITPKASRRGALGRILRRVRSIPPARFIQTHQLGSATPSVRAAKLPGSNVETWHWLAMTPGAWRVRESSVRGNVVGEMFTDLWRIHACSYIFVPWYGIRSEIDVLITCTKPARWNTYRDQIALPLQIMKMMLHLHLW